ncbi:hypothetical protein GE061_012108 [Apolygus lucorum]|uniref:Uncharacterized protein n=1 Tax=Apolygus lucorum TaxID=248454 RepID=A0A8S9XVG7_APOLU|nr:hypothetical protein GE061_012108 [Apolygus lucorum]
MAGKKEDQVDGKAGGRKRGLAPFASLEDLSDDSPPDDKHRLTLPGIKEDPAPAGGPAGQRPSITPRIDISRASSSSHHDDSSPERELFSGGAEGSSSGGGTAKIGLGFTEEMAQELRKSTEELDFQDPEDEVKSRRKKLHHQHQAVGFIHVTKYELEAQSEKESRERKDSTCSEGGLLLIGGRTSRLSSVGSVASGGSVASHISVGSAISGNSHLSAASRVSGQSRLSAASNYSRASRCSSPHRMLLETSFCGPKPIPTVSLEAEYPPSESVEATLLARKTDITGAIFPPEESMKPAKPSSSKSKTIDTRSSTSKSNRLEVKTTKASRSHSERIAKTTGPAVVAARSSSARSHERPKVRKKKVDENALVRIIPLHGSLDDSDDTLAPDPEPEEASSTEQSGSASFTPEYGIYIPLKGPIDDPSIRELTLGSSKLPPPKQKVTKTVSQPPPDTKPKKPEIEDSDLVRFISLHGDNDEEIQRERAKTESLRPSSRNSQNVQFRTWTDDMAHTVQKDRPSVKKPRTPEPKSSSDSKNKKDSKNKSMFTSLFKKNVKDSPPQKTHDKPAIDPKFTNVEFKFKHEQEPDSIIIPLHSPDSVIKPCVITGPDDIIADTQEYEKKSPRGHSPKPSKEEDDDLLRSMKKVLENKNIIVVDVINSDTAVCYEAIIETPRTARSAAHRKSDIASDSIGIIELTNLDSEPRVRRSSHTSCKDVETARKEPQPSVSPSSSKLPAERYVVDEQSLEKQVIEELERKLKAREAAEEAAILEVVTAQICREDVKEVSRRASREASEDRSSKRSSREIEGATPKRYSNEVEEGSSKRCSRETEDPASKRCSREFDDGVSKRSSREFEDASSKRSSKGTDGVASKRSSRETEDATSMRASKELDVRLDDTSKRSSRELSEETRSPQTEELSLLKKELSAGSKISSQPSKEETEEKRSSESEMDVPSVSGESKPADECDEERKGLFHQTESVEDELPYIPTTLPQERSVAVPIIPVSQRVSEVRTCPVDRPRSTTPIQPSNLEEYAATHDTSSTSKLSKTEKMQITLPRTDSMGRRNSAGRPKPWTQFAEEAIGSPKESRKVREDPPSTNESQTAPPPLPPRGAPPPPQKAPPAPPQWVMFDEQPERRRAPKRITTLPGRHPQQTPSPVYTYVNPEECSCECHESQPKSNSGQCSKNDSESCSFKKGSRTDKRYRT